MSAETPPPDHEPDDGYGGIDAALDPEAQLLCALMWAGDAAETVAFIVSELTANDFDNPIYGRIFELIAQAHHAGAPTDAASLMARVRAAGNQAMPAQTYQDVLLSLQGLGTPAPSALHYADAVLAASYRRQFFAMTQALELIASEAPEDELFARLVDHGRAQRTAWKRREGFLVRADEHHNRCLSPPTAR